MSDETDVCDVISKHSWKPLTCLAVTGCVLVLLLTSIVTIAPTETGLVYNVLTADLGDDLLEQGIQLTVPFGQVVRWPIVYTSVEYTGSNYIACNSADGLELEVDVAFQYVPKKQALYDLTVEHKDFEMYSKLIDEQARSSVMHACGDYTAEQYQTLRSEVTLAMQEEVKSNLLTRLQATVQEFQLRVVDRPKVYEDIVKEKEVARSDIPLAENQREQAITKAQTSLEEAEQFKAKEINKAETDSRITLDLASRTAQGITDEYATQATVFTKAKEIYDLSTPELLKWVSNTLFSDSNTVVAVSNPSELT
mmetsp:Transcript_20951/g.37118  ORF Transcript_20951/g.37118 Transcript_20951/m.37118 type:complete len:309 (+) Transcript_20951:157-1083(+)